MLHGAWDITNSCFEKSKKRITRKNEQCLAAVHEDFQKIHKKMNSMKGEHQK